MDPCSWARPGQPPPLAPLCRLVRAGLRLLLLRWRRRRRLLLHLLRLLRLLLQRQVCDDVDRRFAAPGSVVFPPLAHERGRAYECHDRKQDTHDGGATTAEACGIIAARSLVIADQIGRSGIHDPVGYITLSVEHVASIK